MYGPIIGPPSVTTYALVVTFIFLLRVTLQHYHWSQCFTHFCSAKLYCTKQTIEKLDNSLNDVLTRSLPNCTELNSENSLTSVVLVPPDYIAFRTGLSPVVKTLEYSWVMLVVVTYWGVSWSFQKAGHLNSLIKWQAFTGQVTQTYRSLSLWQHCIRSTQLYNF